MSDHEDLRPRPGENLTEHPDGTWDAKGGMWTEDGAISNSAGSASYQLSTTYDAVLLDVQSITGSTGTRQNLRLRINGDTGANYNLTNNDGSTVTGESSFRLTDKVANAVEFTGIIRLTGRWTNQAGIQSPASGTEAGVIAVGGANPAVASPLNSFTLFFDGDSDTIAELTVYGRNL